MVDDRELNGLTVISSDAFTIGKVDGFEINTNTWQISHLHIKLTKEIINEFGLQKPFLGSVSICLPINNVSSIGNVITLSSDLNKLKTLPECMHDSNS